MNWYLKVLKQYADFNGRARRKEYWIFVLFNLSFAILAIILDNTFGIAMEGVGYGPIYGLYSLAILIPGLAVTVRRLHDVGKSGWMIFVTLIPLVGLIWYLILMFRDGSVGENAYGANPKEDQTEDLESNEATRDLLIAIVIIWMFLSDFIWFVLPEFIDDFYSIIVIEKFSTFGWALAPITIAFAVKNKWRLMLFVIAGILLLHSFYRIVKEYFDFGSYVY